MAQKKKTLYSLLLNNFIKIALSLLISIMVIATIFEFVIFKTISDNFSNIIDNVMDSIFDSFYYTMHDSDIDALDYLMEQLKVVSVDKNQLLDLFISSIEDPREKYNVTKININTLPDEIKRKVENIDNYDYYIFYKLEPNYILTKRIYIRIEGEYFLIKGKLNENKIFENVNKLSNLGIFNLYLYTSNLEPINQNSKELNEAEIKKLKEVFSTGEELSTRTFEKFTHYDLWKYEDEKAYFEPVVIVAKFNFNVFSRLIIIEILAFVIFVIIILFLTIKKSHTLSKILSKPAVVLAENMEKFRESGYTNFEDIFINNRKIKEIEQIILEVKELNVLMEEQRQLAQDIKRTFEELKKINKKLEESQKKLEIANREMEEAYLEFSTKLAMIAEGHDETTGTHVNRVGEISAFIAEKLGLEKDCIKKIRYFAPLHDIGKILVPKEILMKKGKLTKEEYEIMKKHTIYGAMILGKSEKLKIAREIALYHHEKYSGKGYPYGLKGDEIPLCAAIVGLVDVYDALRSERPYKPAYTHEKAMEIILKGDGRTSPEDFHPEVLKIFKEHENEIKELWKKVELHSSKLTEIFKDLKENREN